MHLIFNIKQSIKISRPRFWVYLAGTYLVGYSFGTNSINDFSNIGFIYLLFYFLIPANIFLYGINDFYDTDTDKYNDKKNDKETRVNNSNLNLYKKLILGSLLFLLPMPLFLTNEALFLLLLFIFLSWAYSAYPLRFKARPIIDSASNILYAIPAFIGFHQLSNTLPPTLIIFLCFLWTFSMHLFSAIPDIESDKKAKLMTTAVFLGYKKSLFLCIIFWGIISVTLINYSLIFAPVLIYPIMCIFTIFSKKSDITKIYWYFPWINLIMGFLLFITAIIKP